jgi:hypothetical protein
MIALTDDYAVGGVVFERCGLDFEDITQRP